MSNTDVNKKKSGKKLVLIIILSTLAFLVVAGVIIGHSIKKATKNIGTQVDVVTPTTTDLSSSISTSGVVSSAEVTSYSTSVAAAVSEINIKPGQVVKKGDTILTFDTSTLETNYEQASLTASSTYTGNQVTVEASNKVSTDLTTAQNNVTTLKNKLATAEADLKKLQASYTTTPVVDENAVALETKRQELTVLLTEIQALIDANPGVDISQNTDYISKTAKRDVLTTEITNLEALVGSTTSTTNPLDAAITAKANDVATLKADLATQESLVKSAQAGILTETQKKQLNITNELSSLQVTSAATALEKGKAGIVAEQNGIITSVDITKGSTTAPGMQLFTIANANDLKVTVSLSKHDLESVALGQKATITILGKEYEGEVTYISKMATTSAAGAISVAAEVTITNPDDAIVLGLDSKVIITTATVKDALVIPSLAINTDKEGSFVYLVKDNIITKQYVTTGISDIDNTEILKGLSKDDMIITDVSASTIEGTIVTPTTIEPTTEAVSTKDDTEKEDSTKEDNTTEASSKEDKTTEK